MVRKLRLNEADQNVKELVLDYIENKLITDFEDDLARELDSKIEGYDWDWASTVELPEYRKAKEAYLKACVDSLFAEFS